MDSIQLGKVRRVSQGNVYCSLFGKDVPQSKSMRYPKNSEPTVGDDVLIGKVSNTYIILSVLEA